MLKKLQKLLWAERSIWLIILLGTITWSITMVKSGLVYSYGLGFWGPNGHDGVWHLSLAQELSKLSFDLPIFAGGSVTNYHIGFDLLLAVLHRTTFLPISTLYFQILPPLIAASLGLTVYYFFKILKFEQTSIFWILFFIYFGGNWGWIVNYLRHGELGGGSMFWAQSNVLTLVNPPFALSLVVILLGLIFIQKEKYILSSIFLGVLIQIKAYAAVVILPAVLLAGLYYFVTKKELYLIKVSILAALISVIVFIPFNMDSGSLFVWKPFWFLETMMQFPDRVGWERFGEAMINYRLAGNIVKGLVAYIVAFFIFWYGNLGTRFITEIYILRFRNNKPAWFEIMFIVSILIGLIIPMFFVQKGTAWNTIQFFYYSLFFASILTGIVFDRILKTFKSTNIRKILIVGMFVFTLPTTFDTLKHYLPNNPPAMISSEELDALDFLKKQDEGIVLTVPFDREFGAYAPAPRPLYLYESTSYVSAYSGKQVFLEDEVNLDITGFDWQGRKNEVFNFFENPSKNFLEENNIAYIYAPKIFEYRIDYEKLFENDEIEIFKVK